MMERELSLKRLFEPLELPCGTAIKNRFLKSSMSEALGTKKNTPTSELSHLYETWANGGTGVSITGNVMIDSTALGEVQNVVLEDERNLIAFQKWAESGKKNNTHLWMQLNHPGKQSPSFLSKEPVSASAIPFSLPLRKIFHRPRALTDREIRQIIFRFARSAALAKKAGFTGVQIQAGHGYLINQFLSPRHNQRSDNWGGSAEKRMRFLLEIYHAVREAVGGAFPISIKLNSSDFQKGGFTESDSIQVIYALSELGADLVEISGGNYEKPVMMGASKKELSKNSEAYFFDYAEKIRNIIRTPLVLTGGFRSAQKMEYALVKDVVDMVGIGRPFCLEPDLPNQIYNNQDFQSSVHLLKTGIKFLDHAGMLEITWYEQQIERIAKGLKPKPAYSKFMSLAQNLISNGIHSFQHRKN
ncbi:MAG: 2,4-dienoyl-CoA reductase-like NADH-dependent reductase (Old Yellow Enzyme family) [bacterium]|jgi:2,4-dienoyl-CoA reductase-like NADH-dependent reductase (Old Yellow Enzyme family)